MPGAVSTTECLARCPRALKYVDFPKGDQYVICSAELLRCSMHFKWTRGELISGLEELAATLRNARANR
jgi:hypothetical protein